MSQAPFLKDLPRDLLIFVVVKGYSRALMDSSDSLIDRLNECIERIEWAGGQGMLQEPFLEDLLCDLVIFICVAGAVFHFCGWCVYHF